MSLLQVISQRLREFNQHHLREVVQAERLAVIGRFARSIVHDLKNPLNIIGLTTEMACRPNATPEFRATAQDRVRRQVDRISELVGDILDFTQGSGRSVIWRRWITASSSTKSSRNSARKPNSRLCGSKSKTPPPVKLLIDPKRLRRVFFNLVHNATDAMPKGGKIILRFHSDERANSSPKSRTPARASRRKSPTSFSKPSPRTENVAVS